MFNYDFTKSSKFKRDQYFAAEQLQLFQVIERLLPSATVVAVTDSSTPSSQVIEAFSLCMFLFCTFYQPLPSGPPCSEQQGHRLQARHKIRCL